MNSQEMCKVILQEMAEIYQFYTYVRLPETLMKSHEVNVKELGTQ